MEKNATKRTKKRKSGPPADTSRRKKNKKSKSSSSGEEEEKEFYTLEMCHHEHYLMFKELNEGLELKDKMVNKKPRQENPPQREEADSGAQRYRIDFLLLSPPFFLQLQFIWLQYPG